MKTSSLAKSRMIPETYGPSLLCWSLLVAPSPVYSWRTQTESGDIDQQKNFLARLRLCWWQKVRFPFCRGLMWTQLSRYWLWRLWLKHTRACCFLKMKPHENLKICTSHIGHESETRNNEFRGMENRRRTTFSFHDWIFGTWFDFGRLATFYWQVDLQFNAFIRQLLGNKFTRLFYKFFCNS